MASAAGGELLVVAGGIGLAPLRGALLAALGQRDAYRRIVVLIGARSPEELIFVRDLGEWHRRRRRHRAHRGPGGGRGPGHVGVVTQLLPRATVDPGRTTALVCGPEIMMRLTARELLALGVPAARVRISLERNMRCGVAECGHCQLGSLLLCRDGPVVSYPVAAPLLAVGVVMTGQVPRPKLAVWKFASCDGCQLTLLDCEDELLALAAQVQIAHFTEASSADIDGPYDVSLVEGSVTTPEDAERILRVRAQSRMLITIGACATSGGDPGSAQLRGRRGVPCRRVCPPRVRGDAGYLDTHR